jgi:putative salt-induced outer membrane protein
MAGKSFVVATVAALIATAVFAEEPPPKLTLGLAYVATSGNSDSSTGGLDVTYKDAFDAWGLELAGGYLRAEQDGDLTAERLFAGVRGTRSISERWQAFAGASYLKDKFAGLDPRYVVEAGATYTMLLGVPHELSFDLGAAWNSDELVDGTSDSYVSGLAALRYAWTISDTAKLTERLAFFPSLEDTDDFRIESDLAIQAAVAKHVALKFGYNVRYDNQPVPGFSETDTVTSISLVLSY